MLTVDRERRTISGRAVPYGVIGQARLSLPRRWRPGVLHWGMPWDVELLIEHNHSLAVGRAITLTERPDGLWAVFQVAYGAKGTQALELAATTHDGLSIGIDGDTQFRLVDGVEEADSARLVEVSLTRDPVLR